MDFERKLTQALQVIDPPTLLIGRYEAISQLPGAVNFGRVNVGKNKGSHPEVETDVRSSTNPDLLTMVDQASKIRGFGTQNCLTCRFFKANEVCPRTKKVLDQATVKGYSVGGCALHDQHPRIPEATIEQIAEVVLDNDVAMILKNGKTQELDLSGDLGVKNPSLMKDQEDDWRNGPQDQM